MATFGAAADAARFCLPFIPVSSVFIPCASGAGWAEQGAPSPALCHTPPALRGCTCRCSARHALGRDGARSIQARFHHPPSFRTVHEAFTSYGSALVDQTRSLLYGVRCRVPDGFSGVLLPLIV